MPPTSAALPPTPRPSSHDEAADFPKLDLKIFFARSSDVMQEYEAAQKIVKKLAREHAFRDRVHLVPLSWNEGGLPVPMNAGQDAQQEVTATLGYPGDCDIVVTMFWSRLGCAFIDRQGRKHASGTGWELCDALAAQQQCLEALEAEHGTLSPEQIKAEVRPYVLAYLRDDQAVAPARRDGFQAYEAWDQNYRSLWAFLDDIQKLSNERRYTLKSLNPYSGLTGEQGFESRFESHLREVIAAQLEAHRRRHAQASTWVQRGDGDQAALRLGAVVADPWPAYRQHLLDLTESVRIVSSDGAPMQAPIGAVYVPAMVRGLTDAPDTAPRPLMDRLREGSWVVEGGAGSGKTLFCHWLMRTVLLGDLPARPELPVSADPAAVVDVVMQVMREVLELPEATQTVLRTQMVALAGDALSRDALAQIGNEIAARLLQIGVQQEVCLAIAAAVDQGLAAAALTEGDPRPLIPLRPMHLVLRDWLPRGRDDAQAVAAWALMRQLQVLARAPAGSTASIQALWAQLLALGLQAGAAVSGQQATELLAGWTDSTPGASRYLLIFDGLDELPSDLAHPEFQGFNPRAALMKALGAQLWHWDQAGHRCLITTRPEFPAPRQTFGRSKIMILQGLSSGWRSVYMRQRGLLLGANLDTANRRARVINAGIVLAESREPADVGHDGEQTLADVVANPLLLAAVMQQAPQDDAQAAQGQWLEVDGQFGLMDRWVKDVLSVRCDPGTQQQRIAAAMLQDLACRMQALDDTGARPRPPAFSLKFDEAAHWLLKHRNERALSLSALEQTLTWLVSESGLLTWRQGADVQTFEFAHRGFQDYFVAKALLKLWDEERQGAPEQAVAGLAGRWRRYGGLRAWHGPLLQQLQGSLPSGVESPGGGGLTRDDQALLTPIFRAAKLAVQAWRHEVDGLVCGLSYLGDHSGDFDAEGDGAASAGLASAEAWSPWEDEGAFVSSDPLTWERVGQSLLLACRVLQRLRGYDRVGSLLRPLRQDWEAISNTMLPGQPAHGRWAVQVRAAVWTLRADAGWDQREGLVCVQQPGDPQPMPWWLWGKVSLGSSDPLWMATAPVTVAHYQAFVQAPDGREAPGWFAGLGDQATTIAEQTQPPSSWTTPTAPRETVSWYEAVAFTRWLTAQAREGRSQGLPAEALHAVQHQAWVLRLPTEQEWHACAYAAPMGAEPQRRFPWGQHEHLDGGVEAGNVYEAGLRRTTPVGLFVGTPVPAGPGGDGGLVWFDLGGNVWEWCLNEYGDDQEAGGVVWDSERPRAVRGGAWNGSRAFARASSRDRLHPSSRSHDQGFRVVCAPPIAGH